MNVSNTTLHPPWLQPARLVWIVLALAALVVFVVGALDQFKSPLPSCVDAPVACAPWIISNEDVEYGQKMGLSAGLLFLLATAVIWLPRVVYVGLALFIFLRKSDDWMALLLSLMLILGMVEGIVPLGVLASLQAVLYSVVIILFLLLPFIFPNGRFVPRWTRWLGLPLIALGIGSVVMPMWSGVLYLIWLVIAGYAVIYRYRNISSLVERQQIKWVMLGLLGSMIVLVPNILGAFLLPPTQPGQVRTVFVFFIFIPVYVTAYLLPAVSITVAIFGYRLWDIDIIIRKTLTYGLVVALLAIVYFGSVVVLQQIFSAFTASGSNDFITVISTLAIAALFVPLRNRIRDTIERRFYRSKYNAQLVIQKFGEVVRDETDLDQLTGELMHVVQDTMQPKSVSVWLKK
jgi:hypothetical protein